MPPGGRMGGPIMRGFMDEEEKKNAVIKKVFIAVGAALLLVALVFAGKVLFS